MPVTQLQFPILPYFLCVVETRTGKPAQPTVPMSAEQQQQEEGVPKPLPKGMVLGPDGKPCRSCNSGAAFKSWAAMNKKTPTTTATVVPPAATATSTDLPSDCPPDVEQLGRSSWTLLHAMTATFPERPSLTQQIETRQFINLFGKMYPCWVCADDFQTWMKKDGNEPKVSSRDEFGKWMCEAHNAVNVKLGKQSFDCGKWEERWRTGWKDGRCE